MLVIVGFSVNQTKPHKWWAWHPVKVKDRWVWLKSVYRKRVAAGEYIEYISIYDRGVTETRYKWEYKLEEK